jgi:hypothetical protein
MLTALQCDKAKPIGTSADPRTKPAKLFDSGSLYLLVKPNGSKLWRLKYRVRIAGELREKLLALGNYEHVTLKEARYKCDAAKKLLGTALTRPRIARRSGPPRRSRSKLLARSG